MRLPDAVPAPLPADLPLKESTEPASPPLIRVRHSATSSEAARVGTVISRRYEIRGFLGKGGMGIVYRAHDLELDEDVAIKLLLPEYTRELSEIERLKREIVTARKITHPNVIRLHDFGLDEDEGYISMEVLAGGSLSDLMDKGPVAIPRAIDIAVGISEGLAAAHDKGIIHRDMKPENVLFDDGGTPKLVDFGLARTSTTKNTVWAITGTPRYMSPEQTEGETATPRSDVYSTGVLLFLMFTGQLPFLADNLLALATQHAEEAPPRPRLIRDAVPAKIEQIVLRCLEKNPAKRFQNAREISLELRACRDGLGAGVKAPPPPKAPSSNDRTVMLRGDTNAPRGKAPVNPFGGLVDEHTVPSGAPEHAAAAGLHPERTAPGSEVDGATAPRTVPRSPSGRHPFQATAGPNEQTMIGGPPPSPTADRTVLVQSPSASPPSEISPEGTQPRQPNPTEEGPAWHGRLALAVAAVLVLIASYLAATRL